MPLLGSFVGREYTLLASVDYAYRMPGGDPRPRVYTLFQRKIPARPMALSSDN